MILSSADNPTVMNRMKNSVVYFKKNATSGLLSKSLVNHFIETPIFQKTGVQSPMPEQICQAQITRLLLSCGYDVDMPPYDSWGGIATS
jgi:hypothetical protein